jgi:hypothetical protein
MLERDGSVLATTGPVRPSDARLRRAQAMALDSGAALQIARELIGQKLAGQEQVARNKLLDSTTAKTIAQFRSEVAAADSISTIRLLESQGAAAYWSAWRTLPINFPKKRYAARAGTLAHLWNPQIPVDWVAAPCYQSTECRLELPLRSARIRNSAGSGRSRSRSGPRLLACRHSRPR